MNHNPFVWEEEDEIRAKSLIGKRVAYLSSDEDWSFFTVESVITEKTDAIVLKTTNEGQYYYVGCRITPIKTEYIWKDNNDHIAILDNEKQTVVINAGWGVDSIQLERLKFVISLHENHN